MKLIIIFICLAVERFLAVGPKIRCFQCLEPYMSLGKAWMEKLPIWFGFGAVMWLIPLMIVVGLLEWILGCFWHGILGLLFSLAVLLYCLGPNDLFQTVKSYQKALKSKNEEKAKEAASALVENLPSDAAAVPGAVSTEILVSANQRIFTVLFWFMIGGAAAALFYRLLCQLKPLALQAKADKSGDFYKCASCVAVALDWIPARITAFFYSLLGYFTASFPLWRKGVLTGLDKSTNILRDCGLQSLSVDPKSSDPVDPKVVGQSLDLVDRTLIIYLVIVAVLVLVLHLS